VKSIDTNILLYAVNADCSEHVQARELVDAALSNPFEWIVADQVYFELYRLLRNPAVLERPLGAAEASSVIEYFRYRSGWSRCAWQLDHFDILLPYLRWEETRGIGVFDLVLAATLHDAGVTMLYTRNTRDFAGLDWFDVHNPIST
jgi:predicted nucleic acid-binding protein